MTTHPSDDRLRALALGTSDPSGSWDVVAHIETCPECCHRLDGLACEDPFVARVRQAGRPDLADTATLALAATDQNIVLPLLPRGQLAAGDPAAVGGYRIEGLLGRGGMGSVYLARDGRLGRAVALKVMRPDVAHRPEAVTRFLREGRSTARVDHDNVISIWQVGEDGGVPFIAMPLLRGESLADRLAREPESPPALVLQVGREVAAGLAAAHAQGLIHRDIKPANIWLEGDPTAEALAEQVRRCKILDFGLARLTDDDTQLTSEGITAGSPGYMSPEQARAKPLDARTDLFSLGAVLYRMATGRLPFDGVTVTALLTALAVDDPIPPAVPAPLAGLILRLLAKDPAERPASAQAVAAALGDLSPITAGNAWVDVPAVRPRRRRRVVDIAVFAAALVLLVAITGVSVITINGMTGKPGAAGVTGVTAEETDPDRRAAEWVLTCGGAVEVENEGGRLWVRAPNLPPDNFRWPASVTRLPAGPLAVCVIDLGGCGDRVIDTGLAQIAGLSKVHHIDLCYTGVSDAGLAHLKNLTTLIGLRMQATHVTDDGLVHIRNLTELRLIDVGRTGVTDRGLVHIQGLPHIRDLRLNHTAVTDDGLAVVKNFTELNILIINNMPNLTDAGLDHVRGLPRLGRVDLFEGNITDAGVGRLARQEPRLDNLNLSGTHVTGTGVAHLKAMNFLIRLDLGRTKITDGDLAHLTGMNTLKYLHLGDTPVTDDGLRHLARLVHLEVLDLGGTRVTAAGLRALLPHTEVREVQLRNTAVTIADVAQLRKEFPNTGFVLDSK